MSDARLAGWDGAVFVASGESRAAEWPKAWERMLDVAIRRCWAGIGDQQISDERHYTLNTTQITAN